VRTFVQTTAHGVVLLGSVRFFRFLFSSFLCSFALSKEASKQSSTATQVLFIVVEAITNVERGKRWQVGSSVQLM
jgi:hypothetical protein